MENLKRKYYKYFVNSLLVSVIKHSTELFSNIKQEKTPSSNNTSSLQYYARSKSLKPGIKIKIKQCQRT